MPAEGLDLYEEGVSLHKKNQLAKAEECYRTFLQQKPAHADSLHQLGALLVQKSGKQQYEEALKYVKAAIQVSPATAKYMRSLGLVHEAAEQWLAAADAYERAVEKQPGDVQSYMHLAKVLKAADKHARAAEAYKAVIRLQPDHPQAHYKLASVLKQLGRHKDAAHHYREQVRINPSNDLAAFWAIALDSAAAPVAACPASLVKNLFDGYADNFDNHLVEKLQYRTPSTLMDCIWEAAAAAAGVTAVSDAFKANTRWCSCVDLGCGTGLMGPLLRPHVAQLSGVDLSSGMVEKARQRGCYDKLAVGELCQFLEGVKQGGAAAYDFLVAADVFVYIGDLLPVMKAAAAVADDRAMFAFSTELLGIPATVPDTNVPATTTSCSSSQPQNEAAGLAADQQADCNCSKQRSGAAYAGYVLQATGRYAHSGAYLRNAAAASGWTVLLAREAIIRYNAGQPIWGNLCVMQKAL